MKTMGYIGGNRARRRRMSDYILVAGKSAMAAAAAFFLAAAAFSQPLPSPTVSPSALPGPTPPLPRIEFEETSFNAGSAWEGDVVSHLFKFRNAGEGTLHVTRVRSSCGCTAALASRDTLEAGQTGEIKTEFNTTHYRGNQKKTVFVTTDDPANAAVQLRLEVEVKTAGAISPRSVAFHHTGFGEQTSRTVQVIPEDVPFRVTEVRAEPEIFQARLLGGRDQASKEQGPVEIEVAFGPATAVGGQNGTLIVRTDHPKLPELRATLAASVDGNLDYSPRMVLFTKDDLAAGTVKKIVFSHRRREEFAVISAESQGPQFEAELAPPSPAKEFTVSLRLKADTPPGRYRGLTVVRTDQPGQEEIRIPVTANIQ